MRHRRPSRRLGAASVSPHHPPLTATPFVASILAWDLGVWIRLWIRLWIRPWKLRALALQGRPLCAPRSCVERGTLPSGAAAIPPPHGRGRAFLNCEKCCKWLRNQCITVHFALISIQNTEIKFATKSLQNVAIWLKRPTPQREAPGKPPHVSLLPQFSWRRRCARQCVRR